MTISFKCPCCGAVLNAPEEYAGGRGRCQTCETPVHIPKSGLHRPASGAAAGPRGPGPPLKEPIAGRPRQDREKHHRQALGRTESGTLRYVVGVIAGLTLLAVGLIAGIVYYKTPRTETGPPTGEMIVLGPANGSPAADLVTPAADQTSDQNQDPSESPPHVSVAAGQDALAAGDPGEETLAQPVPAEEELGESGWGTFAPRTGFAQAAEAWLAVVDEIVDEPTGISFFVVARLKDDLYECVPIPPGSRFLPEGEHFLMITSRTEFVSNGRAGLNARYLHTVELEDQSGFNRLWKVFKEVGGDSLPANREELAHRHKSLFQKHFSATAAVRAALESGDFAAADLPLMLAMIERSDWHDGLGCLCTSLDPLYGLGDSRLAAFSMLGDVKRHLARALEGMMPESTNAILERFEAYEASGGGVPMGLTGYRCFLMDHPDVVLPGWVRLKGLSRLSGVNDYQIICSRIYRRLREGRPDLLEERSAH